MIALALWLWLPLWCSAASITKQFRPYDVAADNGEGGFYPVWSFVSEPDLTNAPMINWPQWSSRCDDGRLNFITPRGDSVSQPGPMILDGKGDLVWFQFFDNDFGGQAYDLKVQRYQGQNYLTFWLGNDLVSGHGAGIYYMLDSSYELAHQVNAAGDFEADLHEFLITPEDTALMTVYHRVPMNLTSYSIFAPGQQTYVWDCLVQEIDIATGELLFQWRALDHFNLTDTYREIYFEGPFDEPWDWFHINSIAKDELGNYLISARYTHSITYIDGKTGRVLWNLGGKHNSFMDVGSESGLSFAKQHDARFHELDAFPTIYTPQEPVEGVTQRLLTLFDNTFGEDISRGLLLELTYPAGPVDMRRDDASTMTAPNGTDPGFTVRLIQTYDNPRGVRSISQGSMQVIHGDQPKVVIGYGYDAVWTEFDIDGTVLCDVHYAAQPSWRQGEAQSYRTMKFEWTGMPKTNPKIAVNESECEVYMSWNGATEVAEWLVQGSNAAEDEQSPWIDIIRVPKEGFETAAELYTSRRFLRAVALTANGTVLDYGTSDVIDRGEDYPKPLFDLAALSSMKAFTVPLLVLATASACLYAFRGWRSWRSGHLRAVSYRWKHNSIYRRLSGES